MGPEAIAPAGGDGVRVPVSPAAGDLGGGRNETDRGVGGMGPEAIAPAGGDGVRVPMPPAVGDIGGGKNETDRGVGGMGPEVIAPAGGDGVRAPPAVGGGVMATSGSSVAFPALCGAVA